LVFLGFPKPPGSYRLQRTLISGAQMYEIYYLADLIYKEIPAYFSNNPESGL